MESRWNIMFMVLSSFYIMDALEMFVRNHENVFGSSSDEYRMLLPKHRSRRSASYTCDVENFPQPTADFPLVLFEGVNYNNCSNDGKYIRIQSGDFVKWARNKPGPDRGKIISWNSMIMLPDNNITFRACCPSGNEFIKTVSNWTSTPDMHSLLLLDPVLSGTHGIWYEKWLYWQMSFDIRIDTPQVVSLPSCGACKFNQCGLNGQCQCLSGYSGSTCSIVPNNETHPTEEKPMVLYTQPHFLGDAVHANPGELKEFARNEQGVFGGRKVHFKSMRVYYNRTVVFSRGTSASSVWSPGTDIHDIQEFMVSNPRIANPIWYNYDISIQLYFFVKVDGTS